MTEDAKEIIRRVLAGIVSATRALHGKGACHATWTKCILAETANQADDKRYYVCGSGLGRHGEWLFDQTWYECPVTISDSGPIFDPHKLEHLALALESEWLDGDANRLDDFLKLAVSVAETRVMIFQERNLETANAACWKMMDAARRVRTGTDANYLFACYIDSLADPPEGGNEESFPFRFWSTRLHGPLVPPPPA